MNRVLRVVGRLAIMVILITSGINKLRAPEQHLQSYQNLYTQADNTAESFGLSFLPQTSTIAHRFGTFVKSVGLFEIFVGLLIAFGDIIGGVFFFMILIFGHSCTYYHAFSSGQFLKWGASELQKFSGYILLLGISLILICKNYQNHK